MTPDEMRRAALLLENVLDHEARAEEAATLARLLREEADSQEWQPIETAPKNRKLIVGYRNRLGNWRSVMACYYLPDTLESDTNESGWAEEGWYEETEAYEYLQPCDEEPTYWRPLPPPPQGRED